LNIFLDSTNALAPFENDVNWELFGNKNNRFFLGNCLGPAYLNNSTTYGVNNLEELVDFDNKDKNKLYVTFQKCPTLIKKDIHELFPSPEVISDSSNLSLITLSQASLTIDHEKAALNFVLASREICQRLRLHGYFSDFLNPFSGKAFFSYHPKSLYTLNDERFRGLCMKLEKVKGLGAKEDCLLISQDKSSKFSGSIFTNLPSMEMFRELVLEED
jgi:Methylmalonic aciduria and homocystinuria type D protein